MSVLRILASDGCVIADSMGSDGDGCPGAAGINGCVIADSMGSDREPPVAVHDRSQEQSNHAKNENLKNPYVIRPRKGPHKALKGPYKTL